MTNQLTANLDDSKAGYYTMKYSEKMPEYFRKLFRAREPLALVKPAEEKNYAGKPYLGLDLNGSQGLMARFEDAIPQPELQESKAVIKARRKKEKVLEHLQKLRELKKDYAPEDDQKIKGDPQKTIFVGRLNYTTEETTLERQFQIYGDIKRTRVVRNKETGKSRGYAFIEFRERRSADMAYDRADGRRIDGRSILVDRELARVDKYWLPRRLGGGKGGDKRRNREEEKYLKEIRKEFRDANKKQDESKVSNPENNKTDPLPSKRQKVDESVAPNAGYISTTLKQHLSVPAEGKRSTTNGAGKTEAKHHAMPKEPTVTKEVIMKDENGEQEKEEGEL